MPNIKFGDLQTYTGSTEGSFLLMNDSGNTTTYKVQKETYFTASLFGTASNAIAANTASYAPNYIAIGDSNASQTISGSLIINRNLTVLGSSSIVYITSSQLNIGTNIITVNTATPVIRFGGLAVYDSGSTGTGLTGSMLWDSQNNTWIYSNPSGSSYDGALILVGPRNSSGLGNEVGITTNYLSKGDGSHHMSSSQISDDGTTVNIPGRLSVSGGITGSLLGTASLALTASYALNAGGSTGAGNQIASGSVSASVNINSASFQITSGSSTFLFVSNSGNVGIGTTTPGFALDVSGSGRFTSGLNVTGSIITTGSLNVNNILYVSGSNVGIGTTGSAPQAQLNINQVTGTTKGLFISGDEIFATGNGATNKGIRIALGVSRASNRQLWMGDADAFGSSTLSIFRYQTGIAGYAGLDAVTGDGLTRLLTLVGTDTSNVGIGYDAQTPTSANYTAKLNAFTYNTSITNLLLKKFGTATGSFIELVNSSGTQLVTIVNTGNLLLGPTTDTGYKIHISGSGTSGSLNVNNVLVVSGSSVQVTGSIITTGSITALSGIARGVYFNNTLTASANSDTLVGLDINSTFNTGSFTGVNSYAARIQRTGLLGASLDSGSGVLLINNSIATSNSTQGYSPAIYFSGSAWMGSSAIDTAFRMYNKPAAAFGGDFVIEAASNGTQNYNKILTIRGGAAATNNQTRIESSAATIGSNPSTQAALIVGNANGGVAISNYSNAAGEIQGLATSYTAATAVLLINRQGGNVLIGTTTDSGDKLNVGGSGRFSSGLIVTGSINATTAVSSSRLLISGSGAGQVTVVGSGSSSPLLTVIGSQGELFSVNDTLSGSLFSVNDISGLPVLEAFSDNRVLLGSYQAPAVYTTVKVNSIAGNNVIYQNLSTASYDGMFISYTARSGSNGKVGQITGMWSASAMIFNEFATSSFGDTTGLAFTMFVTGSNMAVTASTSTANWSIKTIVRSI